MFFLLIDSLSKWLEVFQINKTDAKLIFDMLREIFLKYGLPRKIISDNGP